MAEYRNRNETDPMKAKISRRKLLTSLGAAGGAALLCSLPLQAENGNAINGGASLTDAVYGDSSNKLKLTDLLKLRPVVATTIAELRGSPHLKSLDLYFIQDPGQEGYFALDAADSTTPDNTGMTLVTSDGKRFKRIVEDEFVRVSWFGAKGSGTGDDSVAVQVAADSLTSGQTMLFDGGKHYLLLHAVQLSRKKVRIAGRGATLTSNRNLIFELKNMEGGTFEDLTFQSMNQNGTGVDIAIYSVSPSANQITIRNCRFGRNLIVIRDPNADDRPGLTGVTIRDCVFTGDYTGASGTDTYNICDLRGISHLHIESNLFQVVQPFRMLKISGGSERIYISGNTFAGTMQSGKQCIDCFSNSRDVVLANNVFDVTGNFESGFENKTGNGVDTFAEPARIVVTGNVMKLRSSNAHVSGIGLYGPWGLAWESLPHTSAVVTSNVIELYAPASYEGGIRITGLHTVLVQGNDLFKADEVRYCRSVETSCCETAEIVGNSANYGFIAISGNVGNPAGVKYAKSPKIAIIQGNTVQSFQEFAAVYVNACAALEQLIVNGNSLNSHRTSFTGAKGYVYITGSTVGTLIVQGNSGFMGAAGRITLDSTAVATRDISGNSWQSIRLEWNPGAVAQGDSAAITAALLGAEPGDLISVTQPYSLQGCMLTSYVSAPNKVTIELYNQTAADKSFGSGLWSIKHAK